MLSREAFADTVRAALRKLTDPDALSKSPLARTRAVLDVPAGVESHPVRRALELALEQLAQSGKDESAHEAATTPDKLPPVDLGL